jgi:hypothetical protein
MYQIEDILDPITLFDGRRTPIVAPREVALLMRSRVDAFDHQQEGRALHVSICGTCVTLGLDFRIT